MGQTLPNNSYVYLTDVGIDSDTVQCITDLNTCCSNADGPHRGDWYFANGTRLPFPGGGDIFESCDAQRVYLSHTNNATSPTGVYRCDILTSAVHDEGNSGVRDTVYVGLYTESGGIYMIMLAANNIACSIVC